MRLSEVLNNMNKINLFLTVFGLLLFSVSSQAANQTTQLKDLGMDGDSRLYDLVCSSGKGTTLFQPVGPALAEDVEPPAEDLEIVELKDDSGIDFTPPSKPTVCTATGDGQLDCAEYNDLDTAVEAVCKKLG